MNLSENKAYVFATTPCHPTVWNPPKLLMVGTQPTCWTVIAVLDCNSESPLPTQCEAMLHEGSDLGGGFCHQVCYYK